MGNAIIPLDLSDKLILLRDQYVMLDSDIAQLFGVETKHVNQAVRNNPGKFLEGYIITPDPQELGTHGGNRKPPKLFTERGLYMLATILKGHNAELATLSIVETYAQVNALRRSLLAMHKRKTKPSNRPLWSASARCSPR